MRSAQRAEANSACCQWIGCCEPGVYKAPRSRRDLRSYWLFCLEHVRRYNSEWNYYEGMTDAEVEADLRFDTVWQRPSWPLGTAEYARSFARQAEAFCDGYRNFRRSAETPAPATAATPGEQALRVLDLRPPVTVAVVKARYKVLVKQHHPDANGGDKAAEEKFKEISEAYRTVMALLS